MDLNNFSKFPCLNYSNTLSDGRRFGILMVKGAFDIDDDGTCTLSEDQEPINFTDLYHGALNISSLRHPSEFVPYKSGTDVILDAETRAPGGNPSGTWQAGVEVSDTGGVRTRKVLRVFGPRFWQPEWKRALLEEEQREWKNHRDLFLGWKLSEPEPILSLPIRYEYAYGGLLAKEPGAKRDVFEHNPLGRGWIDREWTDHTKSQTAPQIEFMEEPISDPYKHYYPAGLGPIPPAWLPRRPLGGTYDKAWLDTVWPNWPKDYAFAYHQSAAAFLTVTPYVVGDFMLRLLNLRKGKEMWPVRYKDELLYLSLGDEIGERRSVRMNLDTIFLSVDKARLFLVWRAAYDLRKTKSILVMHMRKDYPEFVDTMRNHYKPAPPPEEVAGHLPQEEEADNG